MKQRYKQNRKPMFSSSSDEQGYHSSMEEQLYDSNPQKQQHNHQFIEIEQNEQRQKQHNQNKHKPIYKIRRNGSHSQTFNITNCDVIFGCCFYCCHSRIKSQHKHHNPPKHYKKPDHKDRKDNSDDDNEHNQSEMEQKQQNLKNSRQLQKFNQSDAQLDDMRHIMEGSLGYSQSQQSQHSHIRSFKWIKHILKKSYKLVGSKIINKFNHQLHKKCYNEINSIYSSQSHSKNEQKGKKFQESYQNVPEKPQLSIFQIEGFDEFYFLFLQEVSQKILFSMIQSQRMHEQYSAQKLEQSSKDGIKFTAENDSTLCNLETIRQQNTKTNKFQIRYDDDELSQQDIVQLLQYYQEFNELDQSTDSSNKCVDRTSTVKDNSNSRWRSSFLNINISKSLLVGKEWFCRKLAI